MSPETYISHVTMKVDPNQIIDAVLTGKPLFDEDPGVCVAANGACFRKDVKGIIPTLVEELYTKRKLAKNETLSLKRKREIIVKKIEQLKQNGVL